MGDTMADTTTETPRKRLAWLEWLLYGVAAILIGNYALTWYLHRTTSTKGPTGKVSANLAPVDGIPLAHGALKDSNVILITLDTTRADHIGCYGNSGVKTPVIDALAHRGILFASAFTASPSTLPGHSSIHTGLYPYNHGARANGTFHLAAEKTTLAEVFKGGGYATGAFISAYVLDSRFGVDQGFDVYDDDLSKGVRYGKTSFRERPAQYTLERASEYIDGVKDQKFFVWVHLFDAHAPYVPPEPFRTEYEENPYDGEIAYVDGELGKFFDHLKKTNVLDNTLIVLAADHGEGLGEHGEFTHSLLIYDSTLHTPLIFAPPPGKAAEVGKVVEKQASNVDIAPTLVDLVGLQTDAKFDGGSLVTGASHSDEIYAETISTLVLHGWSPLFGVRRQDGKYIHAPKPEFYDVKNDPRELKNLFAERPKDVAEYSQAMKKHVGDDLFGGKALAQMTQMDAETARSLAALGYAGSVAGDSIDVQKAASLNPLDMVPHFERVEAAQNLIGAGKINEAIKEFEECLKIVPDDVWTLRLLASAYFDKGLVKEAEETANKALEREKGEPGIYQVLGQIAMSRGDMKGAEEQLLKALEVDPQFAPAMVGLGNIAAQTRGAKPALEYYNKAAELDPGSTGPFAYNAMGAMYYARGEIEKSREAYGKTLEIDSLDGGAHAGLAMILLDENKLDQAEEELNIAHRYLPNDPRVIATLAGVRNKRGKPDEALALAEEALKIKATHEVALNAKGSALFRKGDLEGARAAFEKALAETPNFVPCIVNLGQVLLAERREEMAVEMYERALKINPYQPVALFNVGTFRAQRGRMDEAESYYRKAIMVDPNYAIAHRHLGMLYYMQGKKNEALHHLEMSLKLDDTQQDRERVQEAVQQLKKMGITSQPSSAPTIP